MRTYTLKAFRPDVHEPAGRCSLCGDQTRRAAVVSHVGAPDVVLCDHCIALAREALSKPGREVHRFVHTPSLRPEPSP